jgi:lysophospholipase
MPYQTVTMFIMDHAFANRRALPVTATETIRPASDGWPLRSLAFAATAPVCGSILFQTGRADFAEKYAEAFGELAAAGWMVETFDWRGQGASGRLAADRHVGHAVDFAPWEDDLAVYYADWAARTPGPHVVIGHSMGGHLTLRTLAAGRIAPDAAILLAPMCAFHGRMPVAFLHMMARIMGWLRGMTTAAWADAARSDSADNLRYRMLTHDRSRYDDEAAWWQARPELQLGPPSWGWINAAYASMRALVRGRQLERVTTPLLMLVARADRLIDARASIAIAARLPHCRLHIYGAEAAHELLREANPVRDDALARIMAFLKEQFAQ